MTPAGFPHSGTTGSQPACGSPMLFAAYRALRRLSVPRHPPCALVRLTGFSPKLLNTRRAPTPPEGDAGARNPLLPSPSLDPNCQMTIRSGESEWYVYRRSTCEPLSASEEAYSRCSRKEVIQPQVPLRLPCYDFAPVIELAFGRSLLAVGTRTSGAPDFHGVTGGVYKARERIHRGVADPRLLAIPASCSRVTDCNPNLDRVFAIRSPSRACCALSRPL